MTATTATAMQTRQRPWWLTLIGGILAVCVGAIMLWAGLATKVQTYLILVQILGIYWLIQGIFDIVYMFIDHTAWGWKLFMGLVSIIAGGYILTNPIISAVALPKIFVLVLGIWGLIEGFVLLMMAFQGGGWGAGILGVLSIIFGIILIGNYTAPGMGLSMIWIGSIFALVGGIFMIVRAFQER